MGIWRYPTWLESVEATDKYTVVVKGRDSKKEPSVTVLAYLFDSLFILPPEVIEKYGDMQDWKVSLGTGPFMLVDVVSASSQTLVRNPNYWGTDPFHPENQLPYLDGVNMLEMQDTSTRIASIRTGKVDWVESKVSREDAALLMKTNPELKYSKDMDTHVWVVFWRVDKPELPFADVRVRRALHMAVNIPSKAEDFYGGEAEILAWPIAPGYTGYTPIAELPESTRELFEYNPDKARDLLAEAGYPDGFKTNVICREAFVDVLSIIASNWVDISVDLDIQVKEFGVWSAIRSKLSHDQLYMAAKSPGGDTRFMDLAGGSDANYSIVDDPYINDIYAEMWKIENVFNPANRAKRTQQIKDGAIHALDQAYALPTAIPFLYAFWQPWVQNYHGEYEVGYMNWYNFVRWIWFDEQLKEEMTGKR